MENEPNDNKICKGFFFFIFIQQRGHTKKDQNLTLYTFSSFYIYEGFHFHLICCFGKNIKYKKMSRDENQFRFSLAHRERVLLVRSRNLFTTRDHVKKFSQYTHLGGWGYNRGEDYMSRTCFQTIFSVVFPHDNYCLSYSVILILYTQTNIFSF